MTPKAMLTPKKTFLYTLLKPKNLRNLKKHLISLQNALLLIFEFPQISYF